MLYPLADFQSSINASFFLAEYLSTGGKFSSEVDNENMDEAINYYFHTLALIALIPTYRSRSTGADEKNYQMHLNSAFRVAEIYLWKYKLGAIGDYNTRSAYEDDRNRNTYPQYNRLMKDSLNKSFQQAQECGQPA